MDIQNAIVILVPLEHRYKLKNLLLNDVQNLEYLDQFLEKNYDDEVWVCLNCKEVNCAISGRYNIYNLGLDEIHILEIIEDIYPRQLEKIELKQLKKYYGLFERSCWGMGYKRTSGINIDELLIIQEIKKYIERHRESIEKFCDYIVSKNVYNVSFEFRYVDGKFSFIDWDSDNDGKIICEENIR